MSIFWFVSTDPQNEYYLYSCIANKFPTRIFSSLDSLFETIQHDCLQQPDIVLIDGDKQEQSLTQLWGCISKNLPDKLSIILTSHPLALTPQKNIYVYDKSYVNNLLNEIEHIKSSHLNLQQKLDRYIEYRDIVYDRKTMLLKFIHDETQEKLSQKEGLILEYFLENISKCISRDELKKQIWQNIKVNERTIDSHISRLRKKFFNKEVSIESRYRDGYVMR